MSDVIIHTGSRPASRMVSNRALLLVYVGAAAFAGFAVTGADASRRATDAAGTELTHLLQMMALLKVAMVVGAVWLIDWRLRLPAGPRIASAYLAGAGLMAIGPGLIWGMAHVVLGAVLLHMGLALLIVLSCTDGDVRTRFARPRS